MRAHDPSPTARRPKAGVPARVFHAVGTKEQTAWMPGLLHMPSSWLHQLIISLPPADRLALFQTCRQLSRQVMNSAPSVTLHHRTTAQRLDLLLLLVPTKNQVTVMACLLLLVALILLQQLRTLVSTVHPVTPGNSVWRNCLNIIQLAGLCYSVYFNLYFGKQVFVLLRKRLRSNRIAAILGAQRSFHIISDADSAITLRHMCKQITALDLVGNRRSLLEWFPYTHYDSLQQLTIVGGCTGLALLPLSWTMEGRGGSNLPALKRLALYPDDDSSPQCVRVAALERFARTAARHLGSRLTHLATNCPPLWSQLQHFTALESVEIGAATLRDMKKQWCAKIKEDVMHQLCNHPRLQTVTFRACKLERAWASQQQHCKWNSLILDGTHPAVLAPFSLSGLQNVTLVNGLPLWAETDMQQLQRLLTQANVEISCTSDSFFLDAVRADELEAQLASHLQGVGTLHLLGAHLELASHLPALWQTLPQSVSCIQLSKTSAAGLEIIYSLWHGLPNSINSLQFDKCGFDVEAWEMMLRGVPAHVHTVRMTATSEEQLQMWSDAGFHTIAPAHVRVELKVAAKQG